MLVMILSFLFAGVTCLVEVLHPFPPRTAPSGSAPAIHTMRFLDVTNSLYLGTEDSVIRISTERCSRFTTEKRCLGAMDPYCGWNKQKKECMRTPNNNPRAAYWQQDKIQCPVTTDPVGADFSSEFQTVVPKIDWLGCMKKTRFISRIMILPLENVLSHQLILRLLLKPIYIFFEASFPFLTAFFPVKIFSSASTNSFGSSLGWLADGWRDRKRRSRRP